MFGPTKFAYPVVFCRLNSQNGKDQPVPAEAVVGAQLAMVNGKVGTDTCMRARLKRMVF